MLTFWHLPISDLACLGKQTYFGCLLGPDGRVLEAAKHLL